MKPLVPRIMSSVALLSFGMIANSPAEDLTPKVLELFEKQCRECHHPDTNDDFPYLHGEVTLDDLLYDEALVKGVPEDSPIYERIILEPDSRKRMPKSRGAEGDDSFRPPLSEEDRELVRDWIAQLGSSAPDAAADTSVTQTPAPDPPSVEEALPPGEMPSGVSMMEKVHWIFEERCSKCHSGDYDPELHGTVNLEMFFTEKGADGQSSLADSVFHRVMLDPDDSERMPKSKGDPGDKGFREALPEEEMAVLRKWIEAGRPEAVERHFVENDTIIEAIHDDLDQARESERRFYRYLTLTNLYNASDENGHAIVPDLDPYRAALSKLINSLSSNARITVPVAVDEAKTVYRIDLRDYNWYPEDWERVIGYYPYGIIGVDRRKENLIERYTGSRMAYVRGDWFTFACAQPPLYDDIMDYLLGIYTEDENANIVEALEQRLGVDRVENLREGEAIRAGFMYSGVSEANRLIERHELGVHPGAYWISYDFTPLSTKRTQQLELAPLGPPEAGLTGDPDHIFEHDGGEIIYNLPNGLQAYMLSTATGERLDRAPIEIVQDDNRQDNVILNGISCMACHDQGIKPPIRVADPAGRTLAGMRDEVRPLVEQSDILNFEEKKLLERLYAEPEELRAVVKEDFDRFQRASTEALVGLGGSTEPIVGLYNEFRAPVTARELASEFGMTFDELLSQLDEESHRSETLSVISSALSRNLTIRRENLLREYIAVVYALGYELMPFTPLGYEDFGGEKYANLIAHSDQYLSAFGTSTNKTAEDIKEAVTTSSTAAHTLATESVLLKHGGKLRISIQPVLRVGERARLEIVGTSDMHVRVFHFSSDEHTTELFPGTTGKDTFRPKNKKLEVSWETTDPAGPEHVIVYAASSRITNSARGTRVGDFTVYDRDEVFSTRGVPKAIKATEVSDGTAVPARITEARIGYLLKPAH